MFSRDGSVDELDVLQHEADLGVQLVGVSVRMSRPSMRIAPVSMSWNRASSDASVDFPEPDGPTSAVTVPGRRVMLTSWMTGTPGAVTESDVLEGDRARRAGAARLRLAGDQFVLVEGDGDAAGGLHARHGVRRSRRRCPAAERRTWFPESGTAAGRRLHRPLRRRKAFRAEAISHRNVEGRVTRSMNVFLPMNGRCQTFRNSM